MTKKKREKRLTLAQHKLLEWLRKGNKIKDELAGYYGKRGRKLRDDTVESLIDLGYLKSEVVEGKYMKSRYLVLKEER